MNTFNDFLAWEGASRDTIDVKKCYIDMCGDLVSGILLSQIIYWYLPARDGQPKLSVVHDGQHWIAKRREDWYEECRVSAKQFDRAVEIMVGLGILVEGVYRFSDSPTKHIRLNMEAFMALLAKTLRISNDPDREVPYYPKGKNQVSQSGRTLTESTTETTQELSFHQNEKREEREDAPISPRRSRTAPFVRPTVAEAIAYFEAKGVKDFDYQGAKFWNYHESRGWVIGKDRQPMASWKGAAGTWILNADKFEVDTAVSTELKYAPLPPGYAESIPEQHMTPELRAQIEKLTKRPKPNPAQGEIII